MNAKETVPILARLAPALAVAGPPALIGLAVGLGLIWLFSDNAEKPKPQAAPEAPAPDAPPPPVAKLPLRPARRVKREDLAEALEYGARSMARTEAVAALQALGFGKTAAYKAFSPDGRFSKFIEITPDGLIEWRG